MRRLLQVSLVLVLACGAVPAETAEDPPLREARWVRVDGAAELPVDLLDPEGKSRWDLTALARGTSWLRTIEAHPDEPASVVLIDEFQDGSRSPRTVTDEYLGDAAVRWLLPDRDGDLKLRPGTETVLRLEVRRSDEVDRLRIESRRTGIGWVHLPSGPREVVLQRALVLREAAGRRGFVPQELIHRWVDPRAGVVAEVRGPASADGSTRLEVTEASYVDEVLAGAADLKIYVDELYQPTFRDILYGWDKGSGTAVSSLTPEAYGTIGELTAASSWDFSGNTSGTELASTVVPLDASHTCNLAQCGYDRGVGLLGRRDVDFEAAEPVINNQVTERIDDPGTGQPTIYLRSGSQKEGVRGAFGTGESRFCWVDGFCRNDFTVACETTADCSGVGGDCIQRREVPLWDFPNQDAQGWYMQPGDQWSSSPPAPASPSFQCEQNLWNRECGNLTCDFLPQLLCPPDLYAAGEDVDPSCTGHEGNQRIEVIKGGVVTLPSGHTLNSLLVSNVADFCVYNDSPCDSGSQLSEVRTVIYIWQVPHLGSVVLLQSEQNAPDETSFGTLDQTIINFGLFPPLSIQVDAVTDTTIDLSWNPGNDTHRISDYVVYWDKNSGGIDSYECSSESLPCSDGSTVSLAGTTATISGVDADTDYFVTVTSRSDYTDPVSSVTTTYESILYPTQVSGDPSFVYPVEVEGATLCTGDVPGREVEGVTVGKSGGGIEICWQTSPSPCLTGYKVLGSDTPQPISSFVELPPDPGLSTCWTSNPTESYFLVTAKGAGGDGPSGR